MRHSKSSKVNTAHDSDDEEIEKQKKVKRSKSVFFDPTTQVSKPFPDLIWKAAFHRLPKAPQLTATTLTSEQAMDLLHCCILSNAVYYKKSKRHLPPNLSNTVYECTVSDFYRIPYFIINSEELDTIFISFRGSSCYKDWHVDFLAAAIQFGRGYVHEGVYFTALNAFNEIKQRIRDLSLNSNKRKIVITGHSLGGAVAGMTSILFNEEMADLEVRSVCLAPVASLSEEIWELSQNYIRSYINYGDLVPFISYYNTYHLPEDSLPKLTHDQLVRWCIKKINKHSKRPEFRLLVDTYTHPVTVPYKLIPPGISCLIRIVDKKNAKVEVQAIDDPFSYFGQFVKNLSAMHHTIKFYKHSIIRYVCQFFNQDDNLINYYRLSKRRSSIFRRRRHKNHESEKKKKNSSSSTTSSSSNYYDSSSNNNNDDDDDDNQNANENENESSDDENIIKSKNDDDDDDDDDDEGNYNNQNDDDDDDSSDDDDDSNGNENGNLEENYSSDGEEEVYTSTMSGNT